LFYLVDSINSVVHLYPGFQRWIVYEPVNTLRLFSGIGMGFVISGFLFPLMGQTIWREFSLQSSINSDQDWVVLLGTGILLGGGILSSNPILQYPIMLLSILGVLLLVSLLYTMIWILLARRENSFNTWRDLLWWGMAGFSSGLLQIMVIDCLRFLLTGTWNGFFI
jgi:hypothetical protein